MTASDHLAPLRNIPLERIAIALGYRQDRADRARFKRTGSIISISGAKFYDHLQGKGAGGAIDLVIHARQCTPGEAIRFLRCHAGQQHGETVHAAATPAHAAQPLRMPQACHRAWPDVRNALAQNRALQPELLEACRQHGLIHADHRRNAVFVCRNANGHNTGAEILGTLQRNGDKPFRAMAPGSRKAKGGFWIPCDNNTPNIVILAESAVDAISAKSLPVPETQEKGAVVVSTAGVANKLPPWIEQWKPQRIVCAYDADHAGDQAAQSLQNSDTRVTRKRPQNAKDWNDILIQSQ